MILLGKPGDGCGRGERGSYLYLVSLIHYNTRAATAVYFKNTEEKPEMSNIDERVKKIVIEQLGVKEDEVNNGSSFVDDLGADSLDTVELVMALEEEFECEIPDEDAEKITTVQQAVDYVNAHLD